MTPCLEGSSLLVRYGARTVLDSVSLELFSGELVALVGPNACGKTTLLEVLLGARPLDSGTVRVRGEPLARLRARERARRVTLVQQSTDIRFALPVRDLVAVGRTPYLSRFGGLSGADERAVEMALDQTGTLPLAARNVTEISGGERQRAHLARAFAQETEVLLLDEPTANLDLCHQLEALALVRAFVDQGGASLVALHDLMLAARWADRLLLMCRGRIVKQGRPQDVLTADALAEVFGVRAVVHHDESGRIEHLSVIGVAAATGSDIGSNGANGGFR